MTAAERIQELRVLQKKARHDPVLVSELEECVRDLLSALPALLDVAEAGQQAHPFITKLVQERAIVDCDCGNPKHRGHAQGCPLWNADFELGAALQRLGEPDA